MFFAGGGEIKKKDKLNAEALPLCLFCPLGPELVNKRLSGTASIEVLAYMHIHPSIIAIVYPDTP